MVLCPGYVFEACIGWESLSVQQRGEAQQSCDHCGASALFDEDEDEAS